MLTVSITNTVIFKLCNQQLALTATADYILLCFPSHFLTALTENRACSGTIGWGTALQAGRLGFDSRWCHWNFSLTQSFQPHYGPGVKSASNRNEYHEYFLGGKGGRCIGLTTLPPWCANCLETWQPQPPGTLRACTGIALRFTGMMRQSRREPWDSPKGAMN